MTDKLLVKCPECQGKIKRLIGAGSGFIFKGSGFYVTDYKKSSKEEKKETVETKPEPTTEVKSCKSENIEKKLEKRKKGGKNDL